MASNYEIEGKKKQGGRKPLVAFISRDLLSLFSCYFELVFEVLNCLE